jgi:hypothetical protein
MYALQIVCSDRFLENFKVILKENGKQDDRTKYFNVFELGM